MVPCYSSKGDETGEAKKMVSSPLYRSERETTPITNRCYGSMLEKNEARRAMSNRIYIRVEVSKFRTMSTMHGMCINISIISSLHCGAS